MKKFMMASSVALMLSIGAIAQTTGSFTVTGYPDNGFAVKDGIEKQLTSGIVTPIETSTRESNAEILISVVGFTSKTGSAATNDPLALTRAEGVKNFLLNKFPKATITALSKGDEANSRIVTVSWKITSPAKPQAPDEKYQPYWVIAGVLIGGVIIFIVLTVSIRRNTPKSNVIPEASAPKEPKIETVRYEMDYYVYLVRIEQREDGYYLPFKKIVGGKVDPTRFEFRPELRDAKNAVKSCLKNPLHKPAIEKLIANGIITIQKKEKAS
jgi:hypothetical protein